uniref:Uncharacterized protein n=1 Tax=Hyaloperonospora arabidopsidis (strain Emoy2) TaxID=559515 RepID=M4BS13_HYAAE
MGEKTKEARVRVVNSALLQGYNGIDEAVLSTTLVELHQRLSYLGYDTVEGMADSMGSGVHLTDRARQNCLTCAEGKQSKNNQSRRIRARKRRLTILVA